jgi:Cdc6-like AAA superfamily ATPase
LLHQLQQLMSNTFNENISILLMGERGTGKTLVLRSVIRQMRQDNPKQPLTEVYLNGFCVRDDSAALREIARQLHRASGGGGSAAEAAASDAMPAPAAAAAKGGAHVPRTFAESMAELRAALQLTVGSVGSKGGRGRPIVLVLDEFDQFAAQNRQVCRGALIQIPHVTETVPVQPSCLRVRVRARCCCTTSTI